MFFIPKPYKLISGLLTSKLIEEALDSFSSSRLSDFQSVLIPELQSEMLALALITSSLFSCQTHLKTFINFWPVKELYSCVPITIHFLTNAFP